MEDNAPAQAIVTVNGTRKDMLEAAESDMSKLHGRHNPNPSHRASSSPDFEVLSGPNLEKTSSSSQRPPQRHSSPTTHSSSACSNLSQSDCSERFANMTLDRTQVTVQESTHEQMLGQTNSSTSSQDSRVPDPNSNGFSLSQVEILTTVGAGTFGRVELVKRRGSSNSYYALKKMRILQVINLRQVSHVISERQILSSISSPFIVNLLWTTRDNIHLYLLMEYIPGGELFTHLRNEGRFDENRARFYAAEIVCAFTYLHAENIVYRDLKPENVLINVDGHIKLTDFGFAKRIRDRTWTLCGTPEYLSPEVILNSGHGKAVDWWSLGILIHEMLVGEVPFGGNHVFEVYENIVRGEVNFPFYLSVNATQIIRGLLKRDRTYRLGNMREGAADVKNHQWFSSINWDDVLEKRLIPPIIPYVMHPGDPANFEEYDPEEEIQPHEILNEADVQAQFGDFKFCSDRLFSTSP